MTGDGKTIKILFLGDLVGRPGRFVVRDFLKKQRENYDFIIANVENASHGFGLTEKNYNEISEYGIDCMANDCLIPSKLLTISSIFLRRLI